MYGTFLSSVTDEDVKWFKEQLDKLDKADADTKREFFISVGYYNEDGSVAEPYKNLIAEPYRDRTKKFRRGSAKESV
jgi:hypothetical protein